MSPAPTVTTRVPVRRITAAFISVLLGTCPLRFASSFRRGVGACGLSFGS